MKDLIIPIGGTHPPEPDNKCNLCKRKIFPSKLTPCPVCKKLFCNSCIVENPIEKDYLICLNCAKRYINTSDNKFKSKYFPLTLFLSKKANWKRWIKLQFSEIEGIVGKDLPETAYKSTKWWLFSNTIQVNSWQKIGWNIKEVNLKEKTVIFVRSKVLSPKNEKRAKNTCSILKLPEYKPRKTKKVSLTRIAIAQARLENISRRKSSMKKYRGKFRAKTAFEKRLWKIDEKP